MRTITYITMLSILVLANTDDKLEREKNSEYVDNQGEAGLKINLQKRFAEIKDVNGKENNNIVRPVRSAFPFQIFTRPQERQQVVMTFIIKRCYNVGDPTPRPLSLQKDKWQYTTSLKHRQPRQVVSVMILGIDMPCPKGTTGVLVREKGTPPPNLKPQLIEVNPIYVDN